MKKIDNNNITNNKKEKIIKNSKKNIEEKNDNIKLTNKNKFYVGYNVRVLVNLLLLVILIIVFVYSILLSFALNKKEVIKFSEKSDIDYKVYLKTNDFYEVPYLNKGMAYVASLIDKININYDYTFDVSKDSDLDVSYKIIGKLVIASQNNSNIFYEKEYELTELVTDTIKNKKKFAINKDVIIDYGLYNNLANKFKANYAVYTNSYLDVYLQVTEKSNENNSYEINNTSKSVLTIPLSEQEINISLDNKNIDVENEIISNSKLRIYDYKSFTISILLFISIVISSFMLIKRLMLVSTKSNNYDKYINRILRGYDRIIVNVTTAPNIDSYNIIKVESFEELIDVRDNTNEPIKYYVINEHNKCEFFITNNNDLYLYIVKAIDLENKGSSRLSGIKNN